MIHDEFPIIQVIFVFSLLGYEDMLGEEYTYPEWSIPLGWALTLSSTLCIPIYIIYKVLITPGSVKHVRKHYNYVHIVEMLVNRITA